MPEISRSRWLTQAGWDDVPHIDEETKARQLDSIHPHERAARTQGIPSLGSGAIYPVPEEDITVKPFDRPAYWPRVYALDVGWKRTAAVWAAWDRDTDTVYIYATHYKGQDTPSSHAISIRARGEWIPGVVDPAARGRDQRSGEQLIEDYRSLGLNLTAANNAREHGIQMVWDRLRTGRLKVFSDLTDWLNEYRFYRRDKNGHIVKENDHLMDATRYLITSGLLIAQVKPSPRGGNTRSQVADKRAGY